MADANDWAIDLENTVTALVKAKTLTQLKKTYPKIVITNEEKTAVKQYSQQYTFIYYRQLNKGKRLMDRQSMLC